MIKIFVISIDTARERRAFMEKQLNSQSVKFEFFNAINGNKDNHVLFNNYDEEKRLQIKGRSLKRGELGCFASHFLLWQKCVELNEPILIIEDDVILYDYFSDFLSKTKNYNSKYEYLRLFVNSRKRSYKKIEKIGNFEVVRYLKGPAATRAYMITPDAAKKFIAYASSWVLPVDDYMDQFWLHKVPCLGIIPGVIEGDGYEGFGSTINTEMAEKERKPLFFKIKREIYRFKEECRRHIYNLFFRL